MLVCILSAVKEVTTRPAGNISWQTSLWAFHIHSTASLREVTSSASGRSAIIMKCSAQSAHPKKCFTQPLQHTHTGGMWASWRHDVPGMQSCAAQQHVVQILQQPGGLGNKHGSDVCGSRRQLPVEQAAC